MLCFIMLHYGYVDHKIINEYESFKLSRCTYKLTTWNMGETLSELEYDV